MRRIQYKKGQVLNGCIYLHDVDPYTYPSGLTKRKALFKCKCGETFTSVISDVKTGNTNSCGCYNVESSTKHGLMGHKLYWVWKRMKSRCFQPKDKRYKYYGNRGIGMCDEWRLGFKAFYDYVISLPNYHKPGYTLDRIDNDGDYEPGNMRWATQHFQTANRRKLKNNKSGFAGVFKTKGARFTSTIGVNGTRIYLGTFDTKEEAAIARDDYIIKNELFEYPMSGL